LDVDHVAAQGVVDRVFDAQLLQSAGTDNAGNQLYRFHELMHLYAREKSVAETVQPLRAAVICSDPAK
jgi:hypothetical protein